MEKLISWGIFENEISAYSSTRVIGNLSLMSDPSETTVKNIKAMSKLANIPTSNLVGCNQTHSTNFHKVTKTDIENGGYINGCAVENCDALYTDIANVGLMSFHADCTPVLLYARDKKIIGSIHAGWRGTVDCITTKMVKHLIDVEICNPDEIYAYIGPAISKEALEVKDDVIDLVKKMPFDTTPYYQKNADESYFLDCKGLNILQLLCCNIPKPNILLSQYCTFFDNEYFYSHRRGESERCASFIALK